MTVAGPSPRTRGYPLNTSADDLGLVLSPDGWSGHLSSGQEWRRCDLTPCRSILLHLPCTATSWTMRRVLPWRGAEVKLLDMTTGEALIFYTEADGSYLFPYGRPGTTSGSRQQGTACSLKVGTSTPQDNV